MSRPVRWFFGFAALFALNVVVETVILPTAHLENTEKNDIYFQLWWVAAFAWAVFGMPFLDWLDRRGGTLQVENSGTRQSSPADR